MGRFPGARRRASARHRAFARLRMPRLGHLERGGAGRFWPPRAVRPGRRGGRPDREVRVRLYRFSWRWRRNPLRRRGDLAEAWLGVAVAVLLCLVPLLGWWTARSVDHTLQGVVRAQHTERRLVTAVVVDGDDSAQGGHRKAAAEGGRGGDLLRWTGPDGSAHSHRVATDLEVWRSGRVALWTDRHGDLVPPPLDRATARTHSVLAGVAAGTAGAGLLLVCRAVLVWRLMRGRLDRWGREWERAGQSWGRAGAGG